MKRIILVSLFLVIVAGLSFGQMAYKQGDNVIYAGIGIGGVAGAYGTGGLPIFAGYEYGLEKNISLGGMIGYSSSSEEYAGWGGTYGWDYSYILIGARGAYHLDLIHKKEWDTYGGVMLGYSIVSASSTGSSIYGSYGAASASSSYFIFGVFVGGRYYFNPNWAVQAELGYGIGILSIGVAYKL
jgi:hypothetical protein